MKIKVSLLINILAGILILVGLSLFISSRLIRGSESQIQAQPAFTPENSTPQVIADPEVIQGKPVSLTISDINVDNTVIDGVFESQSQKWTLTLDKVQHAVMTQQPNDKSGMTFMYGHNRKGVFAKLPSIKEGAIAEVKTENGHKFTYRFTKSQRTSPEDVSVFSYQGPPVLVLQTCVGAFFQDRQLFTFELVGVDGNA